MRRLLRAPSRSMIVALAALMLALAGTGYAAFRLPVNSVGTKQLKAGAVTAANLHSGAVTTSKLKNHAVTGAKLNFTGVTVPRAAHADVAGSAPLPTTLPSGRTLTGEWDAEGSAVASGTTVASAQSFAIPLQKAPTAIPPGIVADPACPGTDARPSATPGHLCVYVGDGSNVNLIKLATRSGNQGADAFGFDVIVTAENAGNFRASGSWAVTAP